MRQVSGLLAAVILSCISSPFATAAEPPPTAVNVHAIKDVPKQRIFIRCGSVAESEVIAFRKKLMESGAEKVNLFFGSVIGCEIPAALDPGDVIDDSRFSYIKEPDVDVMRSDVDEVARVKRCYEAARGIATGSTAFVPRGDYRDVVIYNSPEVIERSRRRAESSSKTGARRAVNENAEFLIGDVLVRLVFPESQGLTQTETWTDRELLEASQGAVSGTLAFQQTFAYVPMSFVFTKTERAETSFEPIHHTMADDATTWIPNVMANMGYSGGGDASVAVNDFNDEGRARFGTDWVYTAFIANARNEPDHVWAGSTGGAGYVAYAQGGGPYFVISYPCGPNVTDDHTDLDLYSEVYQHEMGHIFWALDEYVEAQATCDMHSGYLNYPNLNDLTELFDGTIRGCPTYVDCIMWLSRYSDVNTRPVCRYTAGQMGVIDANGNSVPDVFDIAPIVVFEGEATEYVKEPNITLRMTATSQARPNQNPQHDAARDYAATLKDAVLSIDGVGEIRLDPDDGRWNEVEEELTFGLHGLSGGLTRIQVRVRNAFGVSSGTIEKRVYFLGLKFVLFNFRVDRNRIETNWQTVGETFDAKIDLYRITTSSGQPDTTLVLSGAQPENPGELFQRYKYDDLDVIAGHEYQYYVVGNFDWDGPDTTETITTHSGTFGIRAMLPMNDGQYVSNVAPNPFRETTTISIDIPRTFVDSGANSMPGAGFGIPREVPTEVAITVYDVKGRLVKNIYTGGLFSRVESFVWDGTNASNERVPSGIYFIKAEAGTVKDVKKVVIVR